ncbi:MAG: CHAP domain-containing protein [Brevinema sp.]
MGNIFKKQILLLFLLTDILFAQLNDNIIFYEKLAMQLPKTIGLTKFPSINNQKYFGDCSGFVAFLFHLAGLNLKKIYGIGDNGVAAIWEGLQERGYILEHRDLAPGDIIFFDNTYDMNKNSLWDDELSHIGVVESVDQFHTITYVHYGSRGVARANMNLKHPDTFSTNINGVTYRFNDLLRHSSERGVNHRYFSSTLYRGSARLYLQKK